MVMVWATPATKTIVDNCPLIANPGQEDVNGDGVGDACQPDDPDLDGWPDAEDNCPLIANPDQADSDADGIGNVCDSGGGEFAADWQMDFEGVGCLDGGTGDMCAVRAGTEDVDCEVGEGNCAIVGARSGHLELDSFQQFRATDIVTTFPTSDVDGALSCQALVRPTISSSSLIGLMQMSLGSNMVNPRLFLRESGGVYEVSGLANTSGAFSNWASTGIVSGSFMALRVIYRPNTDVLEVRWATDLSSFNDTNMVSVDGANAGTDVDGIYLKGNTNWDVALDQWSCDAQP